MNENERIEQLNRDLQRLLDGHARSEPASGLDQPLLDVARQLAHTDLSRQSRLRASLRQALLKRLEPETAREGWSFLPSKGTHPMQNRFHLPARVATLAVILILALSVFSIPSVKAFTQKVWLQVGPWVVVNQPFLAEAEPMAAGQPTPTPVPGPAGLPVEPSQAGQPETQSEAGSRQAPTPPAVDPNLETLTIEQVRRQYGYRVLQAQYLPDGYRPALGGPTVTVRGERITAHQVFMTDSQAYDAPYLSIQQSTFQKEDTREFSVGDAQVSQVSLRGVEATYVEDVPFMTVSSPSGENVTLPVDYLMWEEDGSFFVIDATRLSLDELIKIAESLE